MKRWSAAVLKESAVYALIDRIVFYKLAKWIRAKLAGLGSFYSQPLQGGCGSIYTPWNKVELPTIYLMS